MRLACALALPLSQLLLMHCGRSVLFAGTCGQNSLVLALVHDAARDGHLLQVHWRCFDSSSVQQRADLVNLSDTLCIPACAELCRFDTICKCSACLKPATSLVCGPYSQSRSLECLDIAEPSEYEYISRKTAPFCTHAHDAAFSV